MQDDTDPGVFHCLPYELAHPVVKLATMHFKSYLEARREYRALADEDPKAKQKKTKTAKQAVDALKHVERFAILNRRTGTLATPEWVGRYFHISKEGKPTLKKDTGKIKPWIVTIRIEIEGDAANLWMQPAEAKGFRAVRCFSLSDGQLQASFSKLIAGYMHILGGAAAGWQSSAL